MTEQEMAKKAISLLDLTSLNENDNDEAVIKLCERANSKFGKAAAVCVWSKFIPLCKKELEGTGIKIATVVNFPEGSTDIDKTVAETKQAIKDGADEIDVVFPYKAFLEGDKEIGKKLVEATRKACGDKIKLKVIIESGVLEKSVYIAEASRIAIDAGADFIKTSTGKTKVSATVEAANAMIESIKLSGKKVGFKASGGIRDRKQAAAYLTIAKSIMGENWISSQNFRFGASGLLDDLLAALGENATNKAEGGY
ncbi:MAG: deoxyribose-phosphate aldolase [Alphaproteobacteria bacterium]